MEYYSHVIKLTCLVFLIKTTTSSMSIDDLKVVCDILNGRSGEVTFNNLPSYCTAGATSRNDEATLNKMLQPPRCVPVVLYFKEVNYIQWGDMFDYAINFVTYMQQNNIDAIVFDYMYKDERMQNRNFDLIRNQRIYRFFAELKTLNPGGLYGLVLPKDADALPYVFDYYNLDSIVDFYALQTLNYRTCKFEVTMKRSTTTGDMEKSIKALQEKIPNLNKVLLTVQVESLGVTEHQTNGYKEITYSDMCHYKDKKLSKYRKYCKNSLKTFWKMGNLCNKYNMLGVYIKYIDYDDFAGSCQCNGFDGNKQFPATSAIVSGSIGREDDGLLNCNEFGQYDKTSTQSNE